MNFWRASIGWLVAIIVIGILSLAVGIIIYLYNFIVSQPSYSIYDLPMALPSKIVDKNWVELYTFFDERRVPVSYENISPLMIDALISAEDKDFWVNDGFDPRWIMRSISVTLKDRWDNGFLWYSQWASTLTQQIIKNTIVGKEKKLSRKMNEIIYARLLTYNTYAQNQEFYGTDSSNTWEKSKQDIITYYLNSMFFWNNAYGISEAARLYFSTTPQELTIAQSAILAAIPKSPYFFDPYKYRDNLVGNRQISKNYLLPQAITETQYPELLVDITKKIQYSDYKPDQDLFSFLPTFSGTRVDEDGSLEHRFINYSPGRKDYVIQRLYEDGKIDLKQAIEAILIPTAFSPKPETINNIKAPHFVNYIKESIINNPSLNITEQQLSQWWYTITTTLDLRTQSALEKIVADNNEDLYKYWATNRAVLISDTKDGSIIGYIWSLDFYNKDIDGEVDLIRAPRQVGSTLKPLIYAYGLVSYPLWLDTKIRDTKTNFNGYIPNNADGRFKWNIALKNALAWSRNIPAIKMFNAMWWSKTFVPFFQELGMKSLQGSGEYGLSMALWTAPMSMIDLAQWYTHFSDQEDVGMIHGISKIIDRQWFAIYNHGNFSYPRKIPLWVSRLITYILSTPAFAPNYFRDTIKVDRCTSCASKTWTTNMKKNGKNIARDGWLVTYNPDVVLTLRAGNTDWAGLWSNAYGYLLNTKLRDNLMSYLIEKNITSDSSHRTYPEWSTKNYKGQGEWFSKPASTTIPTTIRNAL